MCLFKSLKVTDNNKYTSLLWHGIYYGRKKFYYTGPGCQWYDAFVIAIDLQNKLERLYLESF
jgi:hypothetical protein